MAALGDLISVGADIVAANGGMGGVVDLAQDLLGGDNNGKKGPLRGARLEYNIEALGGRLLMKEPIGNWFGLTPVYPEYDTFKNESAPNGGKKYTKRPGFRFKSFTILLKPGTTIATPKDTASQQRAGKNSGTENRVMGNISVGVSSNISVNEFIEFLKASQKSANINGVITPSLRKHQWAGAIHRANS